MSFNTEHRDNQHKTLYMFVDHSQKMFKDTDLLMDEHPSEYSAIKMEPYDASHVPYDSPQRLAFTRQLQQHQDSTLNNRGDSNGDHGFGMGMMDLMPPNPSQSSDSELLPSFAQLKPSTEYSRSYMGIYMTPSEPTSSSDSSSVPRSASDQSQLELAAHEAGSQDSEDGSLHQQQQQHTTMMEFGTTSPSRQHGITSGANEESPLTVPNISQHSDSNAFFTNASSPTLSSTAVALTASSSPLSLSSPITEVIESPEEIAFRRAEQNRAAQRAFRQRKQRYIKWLESKAEELDEVYRILALVRTENQQLCNLVMELDGKLSHSGSGAPKDLKRLLSPATLALGPASSTSDRDTATTAGATATFEGRATSGGLDGVQGKSRTIRGIDGSLGREISMRLMNLATFPGLGSSADQDAAMLRKLKYHPRSSNISKVLSASKSKMSLKASQHSKRPGIALHSALQPTLLPQQQLQQQQQRDGSWISSSPISASSPSLYSPSPSYPDARSALASSNGIYVSAAPSIDPLMSSNAHPDHSLQQETTGPLSIMHHHIPPSDNSTNNSNNNNGSILPGGLAQNYIGTTAAPNVLPPPRPSSVQATPSLDPNGSQYVSHQPTSQGGNSSGTVELSLETAFPPRIPGQKAGATITTTTTAQREVGSHGANPALLHPEQQQQQQQHVSASTTNSTASPAHFNVMQQQQQQHQQLGSPSLSSPAASSPVQNGTAANFYANLSVHARQRQHHQQQYYSQQHMLTEMYQNTQHQQLPHSAYIQANIIAPHPFTFTSPLCPHQQQHHHHQQQQYHHHSPHYHPNQMYWLDDDSTGIGRGRRSSMPTLHLTIPFTQNNGLSSSSSFSSSSVSSTTMPSSSSSVVHTGSETGGPTVTATEVVSRDRMKAATTMAAHTPSQLSQVSTLSTGAFHNATMPGAALPLPLPIHLQPQQHHQQQQQQQQQVMVAMGGCLPSLQDPMHLQQ